jgi:hypothetical protein
VLHASVGIDWMWPAVQKLHATAKWNYQQEKTIHSEKRNYQPQENNSMYIIHSSEG